MNNDLENSFPPASVDAQPSAVWPPPPTNSVSTQPQFSIPFRNIFLRDQGSVSDFRVGTLHLSDQGITIQGKRTMRYEIRTPIMIVAWLLRFGVLIAYFIIEYGMRHDAIAYIPWNDVRNIVLVPKKKRACLVFDLPNYKGVIKRHSLAFPLTDYYEPFVNIAELYLPDRVTEGKLRAWNAPPTIALFILLCIVIVVLIAIAITNALRH